MVLHAPEQRAVSDLRDACRRLPREDGVLIQHKQGHKTATCAELYLYKLTPVEICCHQRGWGD
ncbi:hypothetical protein NQZ68_029201 [Dissostichus eleginoides]|nr:hypothetical protein NQZ68_029201 [Dissostichus eleginoides]